MMAALPLSPFGERGTRGCRFKCMESPRCNVAGQMGLMGRMVGDSACSSHFSLPQCVPKRVCSALYPRTPVRRLGTALPTCSTLEADPASKQRSAQNLGMALTGGLTSPARLLTSHFSLLTSHFSLLTSHFPLPTSHFPLPTSHFPLPTSHFPLPTSNFQRTAAPPATLLQPSSPADCRPAADQLSTATATFLQLRPP